MTPIFGDHQPPKKHGLFRKTPVLTSDVERNDRSQETTFRTTPSAASLRQGQGTCRPCRPAGEATKGHDAYKTHTRNMHDFIYLGVVPGGSIDRHICVRESESRSHTATEHHSPPRSDRQDLKGLDRRVPWLQNSSALDSKRMQWTESFSNC